MIYELVGIAVIAGFAAYIALPTLFNMILRARFKKRVKEDGCLFLTFDDGPDPVLTIKILDELDRHGATATFFLLGDKVGKYPETVDEILRRGHEIGEHSFRHRHPWYTDPIRSFSDLARGGDAIEKALKGQKNRIFRPPYGKFNLATIFYVLLRKKTSIFWCIDTTDNEGTPVEKIIESVLPKLEPGNVILMHDGKENGPASDSSTVEVLRIILDEIGRKGISIDRLGARMVR